MHLNTITRRAIVCALIFTLAAYQVGALFAKQSFNGKYFVWRGKLRIISAGKYITYWKVMHRMEIKEYSLEGDKIHIVAHCVTEFSNVQEYRERIQDFDGDVEVSIDAQRPLYYIRNESWGFQIAFPFTPFMLVNTEYDNIKEKLKELFVDGGILGRNRDRYRGYFGGILFDTWNIELGTYRGVYYVDLYYQAAIFNKGEPSGLLPASSVLEMNIRIDKELGIILGIRYFWFFGDYYHELIIDIVDTNVFLKWSFYMILALIIVGIIVVFLIIRRWQMKKRLKLIRV